MGAIGKCSALYIQADCENDARYFALLNKQTSTTQDVVPGCAEDGVRDYRPARDDTRGEVREALRGRGCV